MGMTPLKPSALMALGRDHALPKGDSALDALCPTIHP